MVVRDVYIPRLLYETLVLTKSRSDGIRLDSEITLDLNLSDGLGGSGSHGE